MNMSDDGAEINLGVANENSGSDDTIIPGKVVSVTQVERRLSELLDMRDELERDIDMCRHMIEGINGGHF